MVIPRTAAALFIQDSEYSALFSAEPLLRHFTGKIPSLCSDEAWNAKSASKWNDLVGEPPQGESSNRSNQSIPPKDTGIPYLSPSTVTGDHTKASFGIYCELESLCASIHEAKELGVWKTRRVEFQEKLLFFYDMHLSSTNGFAKDIHQLEMLWHSAIISLFADINTLEIYSGRDGDSASQKVTDQVTRWACSPDALRCAAQSVLILERAEHLPIGADLAIHVPRVLYWAALVWYCCVECGQIYVAETQSQEYHFAELERYGLTVKEILLRYNCAGYPESTDTKRTSSILPRMIDILERMGHWGISRKFASLITLLVDKEYPEH